MYKTIASVLILSILSHGCWAQAAAPQSTTSLPGKHIFPIRNGLPVAARAAVSSTAIPVDNGIQYHGGLIMDDANGVNVYYIWYGSWTKAAKYVLVNLARNIGGTSYFNINTTYHSFELGPNGNNLVKDPVINAVHYMGSTDAAYSQGNNLTDIKVYQVVADAITSGALPVDADGVYFLLSSADVTYVNADGSGFCQTLCADHSSTAARGLPAVNGVDIKFGFAGNPVTQCARACSPNAVGSFSGVPGADAVANMVAHELEEAVTDPDLTSWYDIDGYENADLCAWLFGRVDHSGSATDPNPPDMVLNGIPYVIQRNWVNAKGGYCAMKWDDQ